jgi:hypothetical protein
MLNLLWLKRKHPSSSPGHYDPCLIDEQPLWIKTRPTYCFIEIQKANAPVYGRGVCLEELWLWFERWRRIFLEHQGRFLVVSIR